MRSLSLLLAAAALPLLSGCQDPVALERSRARQQAVAAALQTSDKRERERPKQVREDLLSAQELIKEDEQTRIRNYRYYQEAWEHEVARWQVRQYEYAVEAGKFFAGNPKRAHDTAVQMID